MRKTLLHAAAYVALSSLPGVASEFEPAARTFYETEITQWAADPVLIQALHESNAMTAGRSDDETQALDQEWRSQIGDTGAPLIASIMENDASQFLRQQTERYAGLITEISLIDANGFNAGISHRTSDYFQGDEDQFNEVFPNGAGATWYSDVEFDESSQSYQINVAMTIVDPASSAVIGTMTVSLNPEGMM